MSALTLATASAAYADPSSSAVAPTAVADPISYSASDAAFSLRPVGTYSSGVFNESAAEIVAFHAATKRLFVVNAQAGAIDVLSTANPAAPIKVGTLEASSIAGIPDGAVANSIAVRPDGLLVVAVESPDKVSNGWLAFFNASTLAGIGSVQVGALPDMVTLTKDGTRAVVANEGEPADDYTVDPEGSIAVVDLPADLKAPAQSAVRIADFHAYEAGGTKTLPDGVRIFGEFPHGEDLRVSRNLEPEYVALSADGKTAWVTLQEANAFAVVDVAEATVTDLLPLGSIDHSVAGSGIDPSDRDNAVNIRQVPVNGLFMPDAVASYTSGGATYLVTANEGDAREWGNYVEPQRVKSLGKDGTKPLCATSPAAGLTSDANLGRLDVSTASGLNADGTCYEELYSFGTRSFSIFNAAGELVFDSGQQLEEITAAAVPAGFFNSNHATSDFESRSDAKGPEPEGVAIGEVGGRTYAFIGLERVGGIAVFDITTPTAASFVTYVNNRDFTVSAEDAIDDGADPATVLAQAGDLGPEGLTFVPAAGSPTGEPMLAVGNEVSGTTTLYGLDLAPEPTVDLTLLNLNDFHGRIDANTVNVAGTIEEQRAQVALAGGDSLLLSAGDNIGASLFASAYAKDQPTIDVLNALELASSAVGNHEFDGGFADLTDRVIDGGNNAAFAYLGANVYEKGTTTPALQEYSLHQVNGVSVAVIGVVTQETPTLVLPAGVADLDFGDPVEAVNRVAAQLSDGNPANGEAQVIVAEYHEGSNTGASLAEAVNAGTTFASIVNETSPAVDVLFTGHTHLTYAWDAPVAGTSRLRPILQTGSYGANLGRIDLTYNPATDAVTSYSARNISRTTTPASDLIAAFPRVEAVSTIVATAIAESDIIGAQPVGRVTADITTAFAGGSHVGGLWTGGTRDDRGAESAMGGLVANSLLSSLSAPEWGGAEIGVVNPGGLRAEFLYGEDGVITVAEANAVLPYLNNLWTTTLTGAQFKTLLEQQWQRDAKGAVPQRAYLQLGLSSNVSYTFDATRPEGDRITSITVNGAPIDPERGYRIGTFSFLAQGGDNFRVLAEGSGTRDSGLIDRDAWMDYLEANSPLTPDFGRQSVGAPALAPAAPGEGVEGSVSSLDLTSLGAPANTSIEVFSGTSSLGTFPVSGGAATFSVTLPADVAPGARSLRVVASPSGTEAFLPVQVTGVVTPLAITTSAGSIAAGGTLDVSVVGAPAGESVALTLYSDPVSLGSLSVGADGTGRLSVTIPAATTPGVHHIEVATSAGTARVELTVTAAAGGESTRSGSSGSSGTSGTAGTAAPGKGSLPVSGAAVGALAGVALLLVAGGVALVARRRAHVA